MNMFCTLCGGEVDADGPLVALVGKEKKVVHLDQDECILVLSAKIEAIRGTVLPHMRDRFTSIEERLDRLEEISTNLTRTVQTTVETIHDLFVDMKGKFASIEKREKALEDYVRWFEARTFLSSGD